MRHLDQGRYMFRKWNKQNWTVFKYLNGLLLWDLDQG